MLTKAVNGETIGKHMSYLGSNWEDGRAESAPLFDGLSWESPCARASPGREHRVPPGHQNHADVEAHLPQRA
eukprot:4510619-Alexandrium_andersonii.AAC.1